MYIGYDIVNQNKSVTLFQYKTSKHNLSCIVQQNLTENHLSFSLCLFSILSAEQLSSKNFNQLCLQIPSFVDKIYLISIF